MKKSVLIAAVMALLASNLVCGAERRLLEAEEFGNLKRYPYFREDSDSWYAREATCRSYGAPGKGYCAMIHDGAKNRVIRTTLSKPIPAGEYKVFISSMGLYWKDKPNIVKVRIGSAESQVQWDQRSRQFVWREGSQIKLDKPATQVELEAVQFGGKGFGMLDEPNSRSIPVDQIYITSDLTEKTGPSIAGSHVAESGRDAPAELVSAKGKYRDWDNMATPAPVTKPAVYEIQLKAFDGRRNLIPNSSFELGGGDGWSTANDSPNRQTYIFSEADHVKGAAVHGEYALRLPGKGSGSLQFSRVFLLPESGTYTLSAYLRALDQKGEAKVTLRAVGEQRKLDKALLSVGGPLTAEFQRFAATSNLEAGQVLLTVNGACLLDAVQLEKGLEATAYAPRADVEASLTTDHLGHIQYSDKPVELAAWAHNAGKQATEAKLRYRIIDVREQLVKEDTITIPVDPGKTVRQSVVIQPTWRGIFNVVYAAQNRPYAEGELIYSVLPPVPEGMPRHAPASNMDTEPNSFELMKRMGHKWELYCKLRVDRPENLNPQPDVFTWDKAREVLTMPRAYGMKIMPGLWPTHVPAHLMDQELSKWEAYGDGRRDITRFIKQGPVKIPDLQKWRAYCEQVARHLGDEVSWWTIEDETEMYYSPREFAKIVMATAEGFKASGKDMKVSLSCMGNYTEEMIAELGGKVPLSGFGSSSYDYEYWEARKARYLQQRYNVPWFCIGVGVEDSPQFRRTVPFGAPVYGRTARTAQQLILLAIAQDAKVIGHYTGRLWYRGALTHTDYPLMDYDGTPLVHGFAYSAIPLLIPTAEPAEDVYLDKLRTMVFTFRQDGRLHGVTWCNNFHGLDIHWKTDPLVWQDFTLPGGAGKVSATDMFGNPRNDIKTAEGNVSFDLGEEPAFIFNHGMADQGFLTMLRGIYAKPRPIEMRLAFLPDGKGNIDLGVYARNNTGKDLKSLKLDANSPPHRMVSITDWTLPSRDGVISGLPRDSETWGRLKTGIGFDFPVENATYTVWVTDADGNEHRMYDTCWLTIAPKVKGKTDGQLDEWDAVHPAWMYYTYAWARFGRHIPQFERNGEHFKYVYRIDARAAIYTGYDDRNLYVAVRCEDDDPVFSGNDRDVLELKLNPTPGQNEGTTVLVVKPQGKSVELTDTNGKPVATAQTAMAMEKTRNPYGEYSVWTVELAIPLSEVGGAKKAGDGIGFDLVWHDADRDGPSTGSGQDENVVTGTWRWAGRSTSLGTLFFGK